MSWEIREDNFSLWFTKTTTLFSFFLQECIHLEQSFPDPGQLLALGRRSHLQQTGGIFGLEELRSQIRAFTTGLLDVLGWVLSFLYKIYSYCTAKLFWKSQVFVGWENCQATSDFIQNSSLFLTFFLQEYFFQRHHLSCFRRIFSSN